MITPSLIYKFPPLKYCSNKSFPCLSLFLHAASADIVMLKSSIDNVALFRVDNFPQHLNAVHLFFLFISNTNAVLQLNPYGTTTQEKPKLVDPLYPTILLLSLSAARPAKQPLPREIRTVHQAYPIYCSGMSTLLSTCRGSNDFCAPRRHTALLAIYF